MSNSFKIGLSRLGLQLPDSVIAMEVDFIAELLRWNKRINLTSIRTHAEAIEKHLLDSLVLLDHLDGAKNLLDIGSGGGVPGIPLAIAAPSLQV
ncbi:MAG: class I SAM-dependent methyltransferase, partial [Desulfuromonadales bacterium]|nr:class I SAM-dependent methyltransferase [Desulfuromonadales bacterium]